MREQLVTSTEQIYDGVNACTSITIHETDNTSLGADAAAHANLQTGGNVRQASWHIQVDDVEAIRSYPDEAQCWHAGTAAGNKTSIAVEICVNADGDYDKAFARAANTVAELRQKHNLPRSAVVQHSHWTGKNCPARMRLACRWDEFTKLTDPQENTMGHMVSPFEGRLTQNHADSGGYRGHKGMDIAPPKPGQTGKPVYAAFAGTWKKIVRGVRHGSLRSTWAPGRTGGGGLIANPDGEGNGYNHVDVLDKWDEGDWINAGDLIGYNDTSGNQTGPHLHFELWADWEDPDSDYDPQAAFTKFKVKPGSKPALSVVPAGSVKPKPNKPAASKPASGGPKVIKKQTNSTRPNGSTTFPTDYEDLKLDKDFGVFTVGALQILLHALKRRHNKQWDGVFGKRGVMDFQEQLQAMDYYNVTPFAAKGVRKGATLKVDGGDGYWFWVAVQMMLRDRKHYNRAIDGNPKGYTIEGLQAWLNTQNGN